MIDSVKFDGPDRSEDERAIERVFDNPFVIEQLSHGVSKNPEAIGSHNARTIIECGAIACFSTAVRLRFENLADNEPTPASVTFNIFRKLGDFSLDQTVVYSMPIKGGHIIRTEVGDSDKNGRLMLSLTDDQDVMVSPRSPTVIPGRDYDFFESRSAGGTGQVSIYRQYFVVAGAAVPKEQRETRLAVARMYRKLGGDHAVISSGFIENQPPKNRAKVIFEDETELRN